MKRLWVHSAIRWVLTFIAVILASPAHSQDIFSQMDDVKKEVAALKAEVQQLRSLVYDMRRVLLGAAVGAEQRKAGQPPTEGPGVAKQEPSVDEEQLTKLICEAVGKFFSEAEAALRSGDDASANLEMKNALRKLTSTLQGYSETHRVSKLMRIYEGLAWDTYTAVQQRLSVIGNEDFTRVLAAHKQKYLATCPGR